VRVHYEWDLETWDETDCLDHHHADKLRDLPLPSSKFEKLVLVRDTGDEASGLVDRMWAYVDESGMLPKHFSMPGPDGDYETDVLVPQRFHREIAREMCK
jgi:hypothetical protein